MTFTNSKHILEHCALPTDTLAPCQVHQLQLGLEQSL